MRTLSPGSELGCRTLKIHSCRLPGCEETKLKVVSGNCSAGRTDNRTDDRGVCPILIALGGSNRAEGLVARGNAGGEQGPIAACPAHVRIAWKIGQLLSVFGVSVAWTRTVNPGAVEDLRR